MKYFIIAGEASGDIHASEFVKQLRAKDPKAQFVGLGGDCMLKQGVQLFQHYRNMAFMGVVAVLRHAKQIKENFRIAEEALLREQPDQLILVDYPSFNLKMAQFARTHLPHIKIVYYIPPKVWAWKRRRIHSIARLCDEVLGIFPFEPGFYARYGYRCTYVGNPTAETIDSLMQRRKGEKEERQKIIALLPGSRPTEISHCLPRMTDAARRFREYKIVVCAAPNIEDSFYTPYLRAGETLTRETYETLRHASAAVVNSGTATLETALLGCPQVAVYHLACSKGIGLIRSWAQPLLFSIRHFTLVNIISGREVIREFIADEFTVENITREIAQILTDENYKKEMLASYEHLHSLLGSLPASATAARIITSRP